MAAEPPALHGIAFQSVIRPRSIVSNPASRKATKRFRVASVRAKP